MLVIHYHKTTGQISAWGTGDSKSSHFPDHEIVRLDVDTPDPVRHKIVAGRMIERTAAEIAEANRPTVSQVSSAISRELAATDEFMVSDRPLSDAVRAAWGSYRQALRDLSKLPDPISQVKAWPTRPDAADPIPSLRSRVVALEKAKTGVG